MGRERSTGRSAHAREGDFGGEKGAAGARTRPVRRPDGHHIGAGASTHKAVADLSQRGSSVASRTITTARMKGTSPIIRQNRAL